MRSHSPAIVYFQCRLRVGYHGHGRRCPKENFDTHVPLLIVGAGAAGLCAALAAKEAGVEPLIIERDAVPAGSTALSAGLIPAAGTRFQREKAIVDSPESFAADIQRKAHNEADVVIVHAVDARPWRQVAPKIYHECDDQG